MNKIYVCYWEWECFNNGMYSHSSSEDLLSQCKHVMEDTELWGDAMLSVVSEWPKTMRHHLTSNHFNYKAFIGQCSVSYLSNIPCCMVKDYWKTLSNSKKIKSNIKAYEAYLKWKKEHGNWLKNTSKHGSQDVIQGGYPIPFQ